MEIRNITLQELKDFCLDRLVRYPLQDEEDTWIGPNDESCSPCPLLSFCQILFIENNMSSPGENLVFEEITVDEKDIE